MNTDTAVATEEQILQFRQRVLAGEELTEIELRTAFNAFRQKRMSAAEAGGKSRSKAAPARSAEELTSLFKAPAVSNQTTPT